MNGEIFERTPIAVYETERKKLVMVFSSQSKAASYIFGNPQKARNIQRLVEGKRRSKKNSFNMTLAFRKANKDQILLLGDRDLLVLDENYNLPIFKRQNKLT